MSKAKLPIIVFDFETGSSNPESCELLEIAAIAYNPYTLTPYEDGEFYTLVKPENFDNLEPQAMAVNKIKVADLEKATPLKFAWLEFTNFILKFNVEKTKWTAPVPAGKNILNFDLPICQRLNKRFKVKTMFSNVYSYDLLQIYFMWFLNVPELTSLKAESIDDFWGIPTKMLHKAKFDVRKDGAILMSFLKTIGKLHTNSNILEFLKKEIKSNDWNAICKI